MSNETVNVTFTLEEISVVAIAFLAAIERGAPKAVQDVFEVVSNKFHAALDEAGI